MGSARLKCFMKKSTLCFCVKENRVLLGMKRRGVGVDKNPIFECHVFLVHKWDNKPRETEEMQPRWYPISSLPFEKMWAADAKWLPIVFTSKKIKAEVNFNIDGSAVREFSYVESEFK